MKKLSVVLVTLCLMFSLCACEAPSFGSVDADTTSVVIDKKGGITQIIVESFEQPYYNAQELQSEIETKAAQYNTRVNKEEAVKLDDLTLSEDKQIKVKLEFDGADDYSAFNEKLLFVGTVSQAYDAGYTFVDMKGIQGETLSAQGVLEKGDMYVVITDELQQVITPSKIAYVSEGVSIADDKIAVNGANGQRSFIIYE